MSGVLLPGPPADNAALMAGERVAVAPAFDRPTSYFWRLTVDHPAVAVGGWRLLPGDLVLLDTAREAVEAPGGPHRKWCVLDGHCVGRGEPVYGEVTVDAKRRLVFGDGHTRLRFLDPYHSNFAPRDPSAATEAKRPTEAVRRRTIRTLEMIERRAAEMETDPWFKMPAFAAAQVLAVQVLMIRF